MPVFGKDHAQEKSSSLVLIPSKPIGPRHDPEKWMPVFGKDHAQAKSWSPVLIPAKPTGL
jgi:hypothetical protein